MGVKLFLTCAMVVWVVGAAGPAGASGCGSTFSIVASPNAPTGNNLLFGVDALSPKDGWAVGAGPSGPIAAHWNGTAWSLVSTPAPATSLLVSVAEVSATDTWAVGEDRPSNTTSQALVLHHDGQTWSVVSNAAPSSGTSELIDVAAVSATDVWAVGDQTPSGGTERTLVEHWDGTTWSLVSSPNKGTGANDLSDLAVISATNVWAEGQYETADGTQQVLVEHWNGKKWTVVRAPNVGTESNDPRDIVALRDGTLWLVGFYFTDDNTVEHPLLERWNGHKWIPKTLHGTLGKNRFLESVTAVSKHDVWAFGGRNLPSAHDPLVLHWDGTKWRKVAAQDPGATGFFYGAASAGKGKHSHVWGVGFSEQGGSDQTMIEEACGV